MSIDATRSAMRRMRPALGTFVEIGVFEPQLTAGAAINAAFSQIDTISRLMSFQDPASELSRLNGADGVFVRLSGPTLRALRLACALTRASGALFNCTVGGALVARNRLPNHGGSVPLPIGGADDVVIEGTCARLVRPVRVTLDGLAKGLAIDRALATLRMHGVRHAWVNAGGDLRVTGRHALRVCVRGRRAVFSLTNGAIASSGTSADNAAALPGHIVGPSLAPAAGSWTVAAPYAWLADGLTKVAALAAPVERALLVTRLGGRLIDSSEPASRAA